MQKLNKWLIIICPSLAYWLFWAFFLKYTSFNEYLYGLIWLILVYIGIRIYWKTQSGKWSNGYFEYLWLPYYAILVYYLFNWLLK
jgi:hypothetical protein